MNLSIIITVYNKAQYIKKCLNSCLHQQYAKPDDYELIVVNDGSTDNSLEYVKKYANQYDNIRVIDQANAGLSMSRNIGVDEARGEYVWFVDADDVIAPNSVALLLEAISKSPDIIPIYAQTDGVDKIRNHIPESVMTGRELLLTNKWTHCGPFYIYKRQFLISNNLKYYPGIYHEDSELTPRLLYMAKKVVVVPQILYTVFRDPESITQKPRIKRAYDNVFVCSRLFDFRESQIKNDSKLLKVFDYQISELLNNSLSIINQFDNSEHKKYNDYLFENKKIFSALRNSLLKYRIEWALFGLFPKRYVRIYRMLKKLQ